MEKNDKSQENTKKTLHAVEKRHTITAVIILTYNCNDGKIYHRQQNKINKRKNKAKKAGYYFRNI